MSELLGVLGKQLLLQNKAAILPQPHWDPVTKILREDAGVGGQQTVFQQFFTINWNSIEMAFGQLNPLKMISFFLVLAVEWKTSAVWSQRALCYIYLLHLPITLSTALALSWPCWLAMSGETWHSNSLNFPSSTSSTNRLNSPEKRIFVKMLRFLPDISSPCYK